MTDLGLRVLSAPPPLLTPAPTAAAASPTGASPALPPLVTDATWRALQPLPCVYAMGDCASVGDRHYAATAQVAEQQGRWLAGRLTRAAQAAAAASPSPGAAAPPLQTAPLDDSAAPAGPEGALARGFEYQHRASLAFVGGFTGVADFTTGVASANRTPLHGSNITGPAAFTVWRSVYLTQLGSWRNRLQVPVCFAPPPIGYLSPRPACRCLWTGRARCCSGATRRCSSRDTVVEEEPRRHISTSRR